MHELSIAVSILEIVEMEAARRGSGGVPASVSAVHVKLGPFSGVVKEALVSAFDLARETTDFTDCRLVIEDVPLTIFCPKCQAARPAVSVQEVCCTFCGTPAEEIVTGRELEVTAMEISE